MAITIATAAGSVDLVPLYEGYAKSLGREGPAYEFKYLVPWDRADAAANAMMGINSAMTVAGVITRTLPHICPASPNAVALAVGKIEGTGEPVVNDGVPTFEWAIVPVTYGIPSYNMSGTDAAGNTYNNLDQNNMMTPDGGTYDFATFSFDFSTEVLNLPGTTYRLTGAAPYGGKPVGYPIGVRIQLCTINCSVKKVPFLPSDAIMSLQGCVNSGVFFGRPRGTVLFEGAKTSYALARDGSVLSVDIDLTFKYRSKEWNTAPVPGDGSDWRTITHNGYPSIYDPGGTGTPPYQEQDLRPLIFGSAL